MHLLLQGEFSDSKDRTFENVCNLWAFSSYLQMYWRKHITWLYRVLPKNQPPVQMHFKAQMAFWGGKCSLCVRYTVKQAPNHKCQILNQICISNSPKELLVGKGLDSTGSGVLSWPCMQINSSHKVWIQISPEVNWGWIKCSISNYDSY